MAEVKGPAKNMSDNTECVTFDCKQQNFGEVYLPANLYLSTSLGSVE